MLDLYEISNNNPLLAILRNIPKEKILKTVEALYLGGVKFVEIAMNSKDAEEEISLVSRRFGDSIYIGAGTAINVPIAKAALSAGAQFLLAPSTDRDVLEFAEREKIAMLPGVLTPSDVSLSVSYGFKTLKLFPAGDMPKSYVKSLKGPFDDTNYIAIGGVNAENAAEFIKCGSIGVGIGSAIFPKGALAEERYSDISASVLNLIKKLKDVKESL